MIENSAPAAQVRATVVIALLAGAAALYVASSFLIPLALGLVLAGLLWPVVLRLERWRIPPVAGAAVSVLGTVGILVAIVAAFEPPVTDFADQIPKSIEAARPRLAAFTATISRLTGASSPPRAAAPAPRKRAAPVAPADSAAARATATTDSAAVKVATTDSAAATAASAANAAATKPNSKANLAGKPSPIPSGLPTAGAGTITHALGVVVSMLGDFVEVVLFALFVLAAGHGWRRKLAESVAGPRQHAVADTIEHMRSVVSRYLFTTMLINIVQATVIALTLKFLGYPSVLLWGVLTFVLEFIPYFGGMVMIGLLLVVGLAADRGFAAALAGPAAYLVITSLQNNVVSPIAYGRIMRLNPAAILAGLMLWYMLWGVAGAFLAVPILAAFNVMASRIPSLRGVSAFLSD